ncbi:MAG: hypothetical protein HY664_05270 [Chloroflexi bacterium]|nr:hypothetical protein [Chloroflexota bacterium]
MEWGKISEHMFRWPSMRRRIWPWGLVFLIVPILAVSCSDKEASTNVKYPDYVLSAPARVKEAYEFAVTNPEVLAYMPCYCGCGDAGHTSNKDCYIKEAKGDGTFVFDSHGFG